MPQDSFTASDGVSSRIRISPNEVLVSDRRSSDTWRPSAMGGLHTIPSSSSRSLVWSYYTTRAASFDEFAHISVLGGARFLDHGYDMTLSDTWIDSTLGSRGELRRLDDTG